VLSYLMCAERHQSTRQNNPTAQNPFPVVVAYFRSTNGALPQSASCSENSAIRREVSGRTLRRAARVTLQNARLLNHARKVRDGLSLMISSGSLGCRIFGTWRRKRSANRDGFKAGFTSRQGWMLLEQGHPARLYYASGAVDVAAVKAIPKGSRTA
jgi:hypothetical protein